MAEASTMDHIVIVVIKEKGQADRVEGVGAT